MRTALISGITGMDGSHLAELLLSKDYKVHGIVRHNATEHNDHRLWRIKDILPQIILHHADLTSYPSLHRVICEVKPDELYHLGAISYVGYTFDDEYSCFNTNLHSTHYILDIIRRNCPDCRIYFAGTSEMYGNTTETPQNELTPFYPCSPYGIAKYAAFNLCQMYRKAYKLFVACGILFNHTSPRRGEIFASRKITKTVAQIALGLKNELIMGKTDTYRDFGYAPDYVEAMWLMLQQDTPNDFVISTNETHTIREIIDIAFAQVNLDPDTYLKYDSSFVRANELIQLQGDYSKAFKKLGWYPKMKFDDIIKLMIENDKRDCSKL